MIVGSQSNRKKDSFAFRLWRASRPYSYPAAIVPVAISTVVAQFIFPDLKLHFFDFTLVLLGCIGAQAISNLVNDLVDFKTGIDTAEGPGRKSALIDGSISFREMLYSVLAIGLVSLAIGIYFSLEVGLPILVLVVVSGILAVEYTAPPLKLKYHALGDVAVFVSFGVAMVFGTYMVIAFRERHWLEPYALSRLALYNFPNVLLVVAILHANNHRDREKDRKLGGATLANKMSFSSSKNLLYWLLIGSYVITAVSILAGWMVWTAVIVFFSLPQLLRILQPFKTDDYSKSVPMIAKFHGQFGLLMTLGIVLQIVILRY